MFRFTIRDLLWLITLVAMSLAWVNAQFRYFMAVNENKRLQGQLNTVVGMMRSRGYAVSVKGSGASMSTEPVNAPKSEASPTASMVDEK